MQRLKDINPETLVMIGAAIGCVLIYVAYFEPEYITKIMYGY